MSHFVQATPASQPKTKNIQTASLALVAVLVMMAVAQLFTFEKFPAVISGMWLPGGDIFSPLYAALIVSFEVLAVPFLLSMRLSPAMRVFSMVAGWITVAAWFVVALWENMTQDVISNSGLLGASVHLPVGWWSVLFSIALGVLAAWASWGMWPFKKKHHKK
jgi:hypothetical protein